MALLRLIRWAKITALVATIWTISYVILIVGWQISGFVRESDWPAMSVKFVLKELGSSRTAIYETAATRGIGGSYMSFDKLLELPAIVPLLLVAALLTAFYLWLSHIEKQYPKN